MDIESIRFGVTLDWLWRARNELVFSRKIFSTQDLRYKILRSVDGIRNASQLNSTIYQTDMQMNLGLDGVIDVPDGFVMLHCDGSVGNAGRRSGCGGIFRNKDSQFIMAFAHGLLPCTVLESELWGILHGISIGLDRGVEKMVICSDSIEALLLIRSNRSSRSHFLVKENWKLIDRCDIWWTHVPREFNSPADCLASCFLDHAICNIFDLAPAHLTVILDKERAEGVGPVVA